MTAEGAKDASMTTDDDASPNERELEDVEVNEAGEVDRNVDR